MFEEQTYTISKLCEILPKAEGDTEPQEELSAFQTGVY